MVCNKEIWNKTGTTVLVHKLAKTLACSKHKPTFREPLEDGSKVNSKCTLSSSKAAAVAGGEVHGKEKVVRAGTVHTLALLLKHSEKTLMYNFYKINCHFVCYI